MEGAQVEGVDVVVGRVEFVIGAANEGGIAELMRQGGRLVDRGDLAFGVDGEIKLVVEEVGRMVWRGQG